jgi:molybdopterin guanine dinucleotide-containing S/N-oxide reductase-like protein
MGDIARLTNCTTGGPVFVDVKDGKILRITPIEFDDTDAPSWTIEARGRRFSPPRKTTASPWTVAHRSTIYSPKRILTPLRRVDFDPKGARNIQNRGVSGYEPITWEEALDTVAEEMIRLHREVGPAAMLSTPGSHHLWGNVGYRHSALLRFLGLVGHTYAEHNPDSWEGWHWGAMHMWGNSFRLGINEQYGLLEDALNNVELIIYWSADPEATGNGVYGAQEGSVRRGWLKELGVRTIVIDPYLNHTGALWGGKWFAPRLGTDVALGLAIAFTWLTEDTYDKDYIAKRTTGFDEWKDYVLGETDGVAKTPAWADGECGIPAREIRALAREWATKKTMVAAGAPGGMGGACRSASGNEWARTMVALAAMQGLGKPGSNLWGTTSGTPVDCSFVFPGYAEGGISGDTNNSAAGFRWVNRMFPNGGAVVNPQHSTEGQTVPRLRIAEAMRHQHEEWRGKGFSGSHIESQFQKYEYPAPGYPHVSMYYRYGGSFFGTMTETNRYVTAYREGKVPFVVNQAIWFEGETKFADIILPACTNFERWDIGEFANCSGYIADSYQFCNHRVIVFQQKCIEPLGESKSDYEIFCELSKRMGLYEAFSMGGKSDLDWVKDYYHATDMPAAMTWEQFAKKGYYVVPAPPEKRAKPAMRWFAEGRAKDTPDWGPAPWDQIKGEGLQTASGKIEFVCSSLKRLEATGTIDPERPAVGPQYIPSWEGHRTTKLYKKYPLQMVSPHPKFSFHTMGDAKDSWMNEVKDNRMLKPDGNYYWIMRVNSKDAEARGIADGDLIRAFNDRGSVILAAQVTERVPPGTVHSYESCGDYLPLGEPGHSPDIAGCVNILTPKRYITPTSTGMANNSCLIQVEKWAGPAKKGGAR